MAGVEVTESNRVSRISMAYVNDEVCNIQESENVGNDLLDDLDSYLEDINDRLTISRMVSDSVIKGIVSAVTQEAAEEAVAKEVRIAELEKALHYCRIECGGFGASLSPMDQGGRRYQKRGNCSSCPASHVESNNLKETLCRLTETAKEQLERLGNYIENQKVPECTYISSDMSSEFYSLKTTVDTMCQEFGVISNVQDWKLEQEVCREVEAMVFSTILRSMQGDYEKCLFDVNSVLCFIDRFKEISSVRHELCSIKKSLDGHENKHLCSHGSQEIDHFHHKGGNGHDLPSGCLWDANGKYEEPKVCIPEDLETSQLKHLTVGGLYQYFRNEITKMRRDHESTVQQMTDKYFSLKRQLLNEGKSKNDKDFEMVRKNISEVILKLDDILVNNEELSEFFNHSKSRLDTLLAENRQFRDLVSNQKLELDSLTLQASHATEKLSQYSMNDLNLRKLVGHLRSSFEDSHIEGSISEEVYKCILREVALRANSDHEDSEMRFFIMQDCIKIIYDEAVHVAEITLKSEREDTSDLEYILSQRICESVFVESIRNLSMELTELKEKNLKENERLVFLESRALETEKELQAQVEKNESLKVQVSALEHSIGMKHNSFLVVIKALEETQQQLKLVKEELQKVTCSRDELESLISERDKEVVALKDQLVELQEQVDHYVIDMEKLNEKLMLSYKKLRKADEQKAMLTSALEQEQSNAAMLNANYRQYMKQMESVGFGSFVDFERNLTEKIRWHNVRLENSAFQLHGLIPKINNLRRTRQLYKERLDKKCSDLQRAEAEVDVLGDEVDALLSLLEKIYVALDHYSPILQHYPGIIEILKLIRRELSSKVTKTKGV